MKEWKKVFHANGNQKREREKTIRISDETDFKSKNGHKRQRRHYTVMKESVYHQADQSIHHRMGRKTKGQTAHLAK